MEHSAMPPVNPDGENEVAKDDNAAEPTVCRDWRIWLENVISPYRDEVREVVKLAVPVLLSEAMTFMITVVSMIFCGHLGKTEFAGVSLAVGVVNVTGISIGIGLSLTCDTLISQTYGSGNLRRVGVILQRGILILLLACFPCWAVLINTEPILLAVKQSPEVASLSQLYVKIFMPALPATFMYQLQMRYLQNQGIIWPQVIAGAVGNVLNAILNYILIFLLDLGVAGSAAANSISQYVLTVVLYIYIYGRGLHKATWAGWSLDCLQEWALFIKLAIPSMLMLCLKRWLLEVGAFLAGVISDVELGAHSIIYQLNVVAFMIPLGFTAVASLRVGKALGAGNIAQAKLSSKVPIICACIISCIVGTAVSLARHNIGFIFTKESDILHRVADVMITFCFIHVADGTAVVIGGIIRGTGKPLVGALCNLVGYFFIGFPIGVSLMFPRKMGILGLWIGFTTCAILQLIFYIVYLCKLDWEKAAKEALVRAGVEVTEENEMVEMDNMDSSQTEDQSSTAPRNGDDAREDQTQPEEHITNQNVSATTTVGEVLSVKQLVIRRGLALLIMVIILVAGIVLSGVFIHLLK